MYGLEEGFARMQSQRDRLEGIDEEHGCRGPLRFDPESGLRLSLLGSSEVAFPMDDHGYTVLGRLTNGVPCSLLECLATQNATNFPGGFADKQLMVQTLVCGAYVRSLSELLTDQVIVGIPGILEFLWAPVHAPDGTAEGGLGHDGLETHTVQLEDAEVAFMVGERRSNTTHSTKLERVASIEITTVAPVPFDAAVTAWVNPLIRLAMFATRQPTLPATLSARVEGGRLAHVVRRHHRAVQTPRFRWERMLVSHAALDSDFDAFIRNWWTVHEKLAGVADFLFGSLRDAMTVEPQLVTLVSVIEGYHRAFHGGEALAQDEHETITELMLESVQDEQTRSVYGRRLRHANELMQQDRMLAVVRRAGDVVEPFTRKTGRLVEAVLASRNYFVHLESKDPRALEGAELFDANQLLILALECNLLLDLGLTVDQARAGIERAYAGERVWDELIKRDCSWPKGRR